MIAALRLVPGLALVALPQAAFAGTLGDGTGLAISPWRVIGSLLLCLALGAVAIVLLRRHYGLGRHHGRGRDYSLIRHFRLWRGRPGGGLLRAPADRRIRVIEQHSLGPQRSVSLIEIDRRTYAALIAPGSATLVAVAAPPEDPA
ncbi:MAG: flagellar biosynthetic protein FliO [Novosphingobium sp.]